MQSLALIRDPVSELTENVKELDNKARKMSYYTAFLKDQRGKLAVFVNICIGSVF